MPDRQKTCAKGSAIRSWQVPKPWAFTPTASTTHHSTNGSLGTISWTFEPSSPMQTSCRFSANPTGRSLPKTFVKSRTPFALPHLEELSSRMADRRSSDHAGSRSRQPRLPFQRLDNLALCYFDGRTITSDVANLSRDLGPPSIILMNER